MRKILYSAISGMVFSLNAQAQIITETQTIGDTELTITMDKRVSDAIKQVENSCNNKSSHRSSANSQNNATSTTTTTTNSSRNTTKNMSQAEICKQNPRILGYKIQIAVVKSKEEADKIRADFRKKFPTMKVEIDASLRPNYKILAGSYYTKESANPDLRRVKKEFGSANAVQYRIFCTEAK